MHKLGGYATPFSTAISLYRFGLRQFKNMFLVDDRDYLSSLKLAPENISDLLDDKFLNLCQHHDIRNNERDEIIYGLITPFTCLVMDESLLDIIFSVDLYFVAEAVGKNIQIFLKPAILIAQFIASREGKSYHVTPV
ncbi:hypothetical protein P9112_004257 [Eukaryota sp. TZLM1-RC]